jgi:hypothetical protein
MPGETTPIVVDRGVIEALARRLRNAALGGDDVMYGNRFTDENDATLPSSDRISTTDFTVVPGRLPALDNVRVSVGSEGFAAGAELTKSVATVTPVAFDRMMKLRDRLDQYGQDLDAFLAENADVEDLNNVNAGVFGEHITFYEITEEGSAE